MKGIIVNRVSSKKRNETLQLKDCEEFCKNKNIEVIKIFSEVASAGKSKQKSIYEAEALAIKNDACIIVWKYDRSFRNKKDFAEFMLRMYELHNIKVYSVQEQWVSMLWELTETIDFSQIPYPFNEKLREDMKSNWKLVIKIVGKIAEDEIKDKGARVRLAVRKVEGKTTKSYKGNRWGRKPLSKKVINEILELHSQGESIRKIASSVVYWDKHNHKKNVSIAGVHKIVSNNRTLKEIAKEGIN